MRYKLFFVFLFLGHFATAQERSYGMAALTASENKAYVIINKVSESFPLSKDQIFQLTEATSNYWDDLNALKGHKRFEEKTIKLKELRDKKFLTILKNETTVIDYQKKFDAVQASQTAGYGRRR